MSSQEDFINPDLVTGIELFVVVVFCARDSGEDTKMDMKIILMIIVITVYFLLIVFNIITYH